MSTAPVVEKGFTLVELLMVVAIIGLLLAVALPSYQDSVLAGGRAEGQSLLMEVAADQERFYSINGGYSTNAAPLADPPQATRTSESDLYQVAVSACTGGTIGDCFVATATPQGSQTDDSCTSLTLDHTGQRGANGDTVENCWR